MSFIEYPNMFDLVADTPEASEQLERCALIMIQLRNLIKSNHWDSREASEQLGISTDQVSALLSGKIDQFSLQSLQQSVQRLQP